MNSPYRPWRSREASRATANARTLAENAVRQAHAYEHDLDATARVRHGICRACWYFRSNRIGGQAMTTWHCGVCATEQLAANTAHDVVCANCSTLYELCTQCGGDLHTRAGRRKWPTPMPAPSHSQV